MSEGIKNSFTALKGLLKANLEDVVAYFSESRENSLLVYLMIAFSSFIVCIGLNFNQSLIVYSGLLISPFIFSFIQFAIGVYKRDNALAFQSLSKAVLGSILTLIIGILYFYLTPFAYDIKALENWSMVDIPTYIVVFLIGLCLDLFNRHRVPLIIWILKILVKWSVLIVLTGLALIKGNFEWVIQLVICYKLTFILLFLGLILLLYSFGIAKNEVSQNKFKFLYPAVIILSIIFGMYYGFIEISRLTTKYNTEQYIANELSSKSFVVNNFLIEKNNKEITVYYSGLKPAMAQDENLKKKYHLSGYHFEYKEFK